MASSQVKVLSVELDDLPRTTIGVRNRKGVWEETVRLKLQANSVFITLDATEEEINAFIKDLNCFSAD